MARRVTLIGAVRAFWRRLRRRKRLSGVKCVTSMSALPDSLGSTLYVVGTAVPKWAVLACPCRCGERIDVNLMRNKKPNWSLSIAADRATLSPSLWVPAAKCGSHFFVHNNRIDWVPEVSSWQKI